MASQKNSAIHNNEDQSIKTEWFFSVKRSLHVDVLFDLLS